MNGQRKNIYTYTMEYYTAIKKTEILSFVAKWLELENIMLGEISQTKKNKCHISALTCGKRKECGRGGEE